MSYHKATIRIKKQKSQHLPMGCMLAFMCYSVWVEDVKQLLVRVYAAGVACHLNIRHYKISENKLSENFAQNCRLFQMPELLGNIREFGSFKVTAEWLVEMNQVLSISRLSRICLPSEHLSENKLPHPPL